MYSASNFHTNIFTKEQIQILRPSGSGPGWKYGLTPFNYVSDNGIIEFLCSP